MSLSSKELHKICHMRLQGKPWREIKEAIPHKNVYQKASMLQVDLSFKGSSKGKSMIVLPYRWAGKSNLYDTVKGFSKG